MAAENSLSPFLLTTNPRNFMTKRKSSLQLVDNSTNVKSTKCKVLDSDLRKDISALTFNQAAFFELYDKQERAILLHGAAGTGKTYIAMYKALGEVLSRGTEFHKLILVRSAVPSRDIGHLPGDAAEKTEIYQLPYNDICSDLFNHVKPYQRLIEQKNLEFMITSFVRGITLDNSIVIVDECQNMTDMELNSIMTRIGRNSKIIFCGDFRQSDLYKKNDLSGLQKFMAIADMMPSFNMIEFTIDDIVRSDIVKEYLIARMEYEDRTAA